MMRKYALFKRAGRRIDGANVGILNGVKKAVTYIEKQRGEATCAWPASKRRKEGMA